MNDNHQDYDAEAHLKKLDEQSRMRVQQFVTSIAAGDPRSAFEALAPLMEDGEGLRHALREVVAAGIDSTDEVRAAFLHVWVMREGIRDDVGDDDLLLDALRLLLPKYDGPDKRLYRGDTKLAHESGAHGWAWSSSPKVALSFAEAAQAHPEGAVLLAVDAPVKSIFCAPAQHSHIRDGEDEYLVDPRVLADRGIQVHVVEELAHVPQSKK